MRHIGHSSGADVYFISPQLTLKARGGKCIWMHISVAAQILCGNFLSFCVAVIFLALHKHTNTHRGPDSGFMGLSGRCGNNIIYRWSCNK